MIPLANATAEILARKTPHAVRRHRRKRGHFGRAGREYITMRREPVGLFLGVAFVLSGVAVVEYLHLDSIRQSALARFEISDRRLTSPQKDAGIAAGPEMPPLRDQFQVGVGLLRPDDPHRLAGAVHAVRMPSERVGRAVYDSEVCLAQCAPAQSSAINRGLW